MVKRFLSKTINYFLVVAVMVFLLLMGAYAGRFFNLSFLDKYFPKNNLILEQKTVREESAVIDIASKASPSVVTVTVKTPTRKILQFSPFGGFSQRIEEGEETDIGTGFVVSKDGLIVTNKHVVSADVSYKIVTKDDKEYDVESINRDPNNDIAILKINCRNIVVFLEII